MSWNTASNTAWTTQDLPDVDFPNRLEAQLIFLYQYNKGNPNSDFEMSPM